MVEEKSNTQKLINPGLTPMTYWATEVEWRAYAYQCELYRTTFGTNVTPHTNPYTATNGFQVLLKPIIQGWVDQHANVQREVLVKDLISTASSLSDEELKDLVKSIQATNKPPAIPGL